VSIPETAPAEFHGQASVALSIAKLASSRASIYIACTVAALASNYLLGADMSWDTVNYQLYAGFSAVNDRFAQDYFPAGPQSYFNPYAYAPFYALVKAGLSSLELSSALAIVHSVLLWLTFELAVCAAPVSNRGLRIGYGICAVAMALVNPILLQQIGSSYADITTAIIVLAGWLLLAHAVRAPRAAQVVCAGLLLGIATALKLTNAIHAIAGIAMLVMLPLPVTARVRHWLVYSISVGAGFTIVCAPWSYRLERMFGNPMFPLMNGLFRSPEFTSEPLRHFRFIPDSITAALWRPFAIVDPVPMVQEELTAPDLRYAVLVSLIGFILLRSVWRRIKQSPHSSGRVELDASARILVALGCVATLDWILWLSASGNGRYFLPMASLTAVLIVALLFRLLAARPKMRNYIFAGLMALQIAQLNIGANLRWNPVPWSRQWLDVQVPEILSTDPSLYLSVGVQSNSFIAAYLASGSGLINFSGGYALAPDGASGARIQVLMHRYAPHLRVLWRTAQPLAAIALVEPHHLSVEDPLSSFGLRIDPSDCATITVHGLPTEPELTIQSTDHPEAVHPRTDYTSYLSTCHVLSDDSDRSALIARQRAVDLVFDRLEDACPALFQPRRLHTEHDGQFWRRLYINTDLVATISHGSVKFLNPVRGGRPIDLGLESDWTKAPPRLACGRRDGRWFANVLQTNEVR
jgi:hypothetical protein